MNNINTENNNQQWWYEFNGQQVRSLLEDSMQLLIQDGKLKAETLVWQEGMANWMPLRDTRLAKYIGASSDTRQQLKQWWYESNGQQTGLVSNEEISQLVKAGRLNSQSLVWQQGMNAWIQLRHTEFAGKTASISTPPIVIQKWYNNKTKFWLSLLLWPLFIYALIKTDLYKKEAKTIIFILLGAFLFVAYVMPEGSDNSSSSFEEGAPSWQSPWDFSVSCVEQYIKDHANDSGSYESIDWDMATRNDDGTYTVFHTFTLKNGFGGRVKKTMIFKVSGDGQTVLSAQ